MNWWVFSIAITFVILTLFLSISMYWTVKWPNWKAAPYNAFPDIIKELGPPSSANYSAGGMASWTHKQLDNEPWMTVIVRDEEIPNCCPIESKDFLYCSVCVDIPSALVESMLLSFNEGIWYDSGKNRLWVRSDSLRASVGTVLFLVGILSAVQEKGEKVVYDSFWENEDAGKEEYAKSVAAVVSASDEDYNNAKQTLIDALNVLGCPSLEECSGAECDNPWSPSVLEADLTASGIDSIPPATDDTAESYTATDPDMSGSGCGAYHPEVDKYSLGMNPVDSTDHNKQPYTLGYPNDQALPFNALSLTRESYTPNKMDINHNLLLERECTTCNRKRNGRPMTISAV